MSLLLHILFSFREAHASTLVKGTGVFSSYEMMKGDCFMEAKNGDTVLVRYALRVNGELVETNKEGEPLRVTIGSGKLIKGFENALIGMKEGEEKTVTLTPEEAYGNPRDDLVQEIPRAALQGNPQEGMHVQARDPATGATFTGVITRVGDETLTVDFNHPLAGRTLEFTITLEKILPKEEA